VEINEQRIRIYGRNGHFPVRLLPCSGLVDACEGFSGMDVRDFYSLLYNIDIVDTSAFHKAYPENQLGRKF
jgi:hypothetical protein